MRNAFYSTVEKEVALWPVIVHLNPKEKFQALLAQQETVGLLAKFSHDVVTALNVRECSIVYSCNGSI